MLKQINLCPILAWFGNSTAMGGFFFSPLVFIVKISVRLTLGVIHKPRGFQIGIFWPPLPPLNAIVIRNSVFPYPGVVKDRPSSWPSVQILNNFRGMIGKIFNFRTDQIIFRDVVCQERVGLVEFEYFQKDVVQFLRFTNKKLNFSIFRSFWRFFCIFKILYTETIYRSIPIIINRAFQNDYFKSIE